LGWQIDPESGFAVSVKAEFDSPEFDSPITMRQNGLDATLGLTIKES